MIVPFKPGIMHFTSSDADTNYLIGSKCQSCGAVAFPKRFICHKCMSENMAEVPLSQKGKLAAFTVAWAAPKGVKTPLVMAYINLPEGVRLFSMVTGCKISRDALEVGQEMELVFEEIREENGQKVVAFKFKPITAGE